MDLDTADYRSITVEDQRPLCLVKSEPHSHDGYLLGVVIIFTMLVLIIKFGNPPKKGSK